MSKRFLLCRKENTEAPGENSLKQAEVEQGTGYSECLMNDSWLIQSWNSVLICSGANTAGAENTLISYQGCVLKCQVARPANNKPVIYSDHLKGCLKCTTTCCHILEKQSVNKPLVNSLVKDDYRWDRGQRWKLRAGWERIHGSGKDKQEFVLSLPNYCCFLWLLTSKVTLYFMFYLDKSNESHWNAQQWAALMTTECSRWWQVTLFTWETGQPSLLVKCPLKE